MYGYLVADGILTQAENPAAGAAKPRGLRSARMALPNSAQNARPVMSSQMSSIFSTSPSVPRPCSSRSRMRTSQNVPSRHGVHFPARLVLVELGPAEPRTPPAALSRADHGPGRGVSLVAFVRDPDGNLVEFLQRPARPGPPG